MCSQPIVQAAHEFRATRRDPSERVARNSLRDSCADRGEFGEPIHLLACRPADAAQREHSEEGIVKGPIVMAGTRDEDAPAAVLAGPHLRTRRSFLHGGGRVFVSIPGHYNWTFDDPLFRVLALRGICWAARQPMDRLVDLATIGARITE